MAEARITVLVENTAGRRGLLAEHGLSLWIEFTGKHILLDTGQGRVLGPNARRLGIALGQADAIVLSHGHYDHTGGLAEALLATQRPRLLVHPEAFAPKFARNADGSARDIGLPGLSKQEVCDRADVVWTDRPTEVFSGFCLTGPIPRTTDFEDTGGAFFRDSDCATPDDLVDDQAALFETAAGTVVLLGCAHSGIVNTLRYIQTLTASRPIHTIIGGMHLHNARAERLDRTVTELRRLGV